MDSKVIWNIEHILSNELRIYVMCDKNKRLMSNRFYVTFFDAISVLVGEHLIVTEMCSINKLSLHVCIELKYSFTWRLWHISLYCSFCAAYPMCTFLKSSLDNFLTLDADLFSHLDCSTCTSLCEYWWGRHVNRPLQDLWWFLNWLLISFNLRTLTWQCKWKKNVQ